VVTSSKVPTGNIAWTQIEVTQPTIATIGVEGMMKIYATKYNVSLSVARRIIWCESKFKPQAVRLNKTEAGEVWSKDIGLWQINNYWNEKDLNKLGWDIYDPGQNLEAGFYLMSMRGTQPWLWSKYCWDN